MNPKTINSGVAKTVSRGGENHTNVLSIVVDGVECAQMDLEKECRVRFEIDAGAELIEVSAHDETGRISLASLLVPFDPTSGRQQPAAVAVTLPGGAQRVSLSVSPRQDPGGEANGAEVEVGFYEV